MKNLNSEEMKSGRTWFFTAAILSILIALFLYNYDQYATNSDKEIIKGQEIKELRIAQSSLTSNNTDPRNQVNP